MATVKVSLPTDLVLDVMVLSDVHNAQDAVELVLRDYVQRGRRTEAVTGGASEVRRDIEGRQREAGT